MKVIRSFDVSRDSLREQNGELQNERKREMKCATTMRALEIYCRVVVSFSISRVRLCLEYEE